MFRIFCIISSVSGTGSRSFYLEIEEGATLKVRKGASDALSKGSGAHGRVK